jgi:hypothetical protein
VGSGSGTLNPNPRTRTRSIGGRSGAPPTPQPEPQAATTTLSKNSPQQETPPAKSVSSVVAAVPERIGAADGWSRSPSRVSEDRWHADRPADPLASGSGARPQSTNPCAALRARSPASRSLLVHSDPVRKQELREGRVESNLHRLPSLPALEMLDLTGRILAACMALPLRMARSRTPIDAWNEQTRLLRSLADECQSVGFRMMVAGFVPLRQSSSTLRRKEHSRPPRRFQSTMGKTMTNVR